MPRFNWMPWVCAGMLACEGSTPRAADPAPGSKRKAPAQSPNPAKPPASDPATPAPNTPTPTPSPTAVTPTSSGEGFAVLLPSTSIGRAGKAVPLDVTNALGEPLKPPALAGHPAGFVLRVVGRDGTRVHVRTIPGPPKDACGHALYGLEWAEVDLWVDENELAAVRADESTFTFEDGTSAKVAPGVPFYEEDGRWMADAWGVRVALDRKPDGFVHVFPERQSFAREGAKGRMKSDAPFTVGGRQVSAFSMYGDEGGTLTYGGTEEAPIVRSPCMELTGRMDAKAPVDGGTLGVGFGGGFGGGDPKMGVDQVVAGARLRWSDGSDAGRAVTEKFLSGAWTPGKDGDRCYRVSAGGAGSHLNLCPAAKEAIQLPWPTVSVAKASGLEGEASGHAGTFAMMALRDRCFAEALHRRPEAKGGIDVVLTFAAQGKVKTVSVADAGFGDPEAVACANRVLAAHTFPPQVGAGTLEATLQVRPWTGGASRNTGKVPRSGPIK